MKVMKAKFGIISIICGLAYVGLSIILAQSMHWRIHECLLPLACILPLVGLVFSIISISKKEEPKCLCYIGLVLNLLPFVKLIFGLLFLAVADIMGLRIDM